MKKTIALLLCLALMLPFTPPAAAETISAEASVNDLTEKTEILSKRDAYSKTYRLSDGTYQYVGYAEPIHYKDSTGAYVEINNEITDTANLVGYAYTNTADGYKYTNTANGWNAHFSEKLNNNNAVMLTSGAYNIAFSFAEQTGTATVMKATTMAPVNAKSALSAYHQKLSADNRAVIYKDVAENVDIAYTVQPGALKEDIILKSKQAPAAFKFRLTTNGLTLKESGSTFGLFTASGEEVFTFAPLYMEDANGKRSDKVSLTYSSVKNGYELTVCADTEFLNAADTIYPVVIDPSVMVTGADITLDTWVDQDYPTTNFYLSENLWTGGALGDNAMHTYIKFNFPTDFSPSQIMTAFVYLRKKDYQTPTIKAYPVTGDWSSSTITWNNKPGYDSTIYSPVAYNSSGDWYQLDVTTILQCWLNNAFPNYGLVLRESEETDSEQYTKFYSSDAPSPNKPELVINYNGKTLFDVPANLKVVTNGDFSCIPCAITNVAAYWSVNGYAQFGCSTAAAQETVVRNVQSTMIAVGGSSGHEANDNIPAGFNVFSHSTGTTTYRLRATNYWAKKNEFTFDDIVTEIEAGRPLLLGFAGTTDCPFGGGHMTACAGYKCTGTKEYVIVSDGWYTYLRTFDFRIETYNDFIAKVEIVSE